MRPAVPAAVAVLLLSVAATPASGSLPDKGGRAAQDAKPCLPLGGLLVRETIRKRSADREEVTERLGRNLYRVTRCDLNGELTQSMTVEPVKDPDGRLVLAPGTIVRPDRVLITDYGDARDPRWARAWRLVRAKFVRAILKQTAGRPAPDPAFDPSKATGASVPRGALAFAAAGGACNEGGHDATGAKWPDKRYTWRYNSASFGGNPATLDALKLAHDAWDKSYNNCDFNDLSTITAVYEGTTSAQAGTLDNIGAMDKGNVGSTGCPGAIACTVTWRSGETAVESDTRFSTSVKWSTSGAKGAYDYRHVATHEFGHTIGLGDLHSNPNLTMYYQTKTGATANSTLGRGDIAGMRQLYP